jgi:sphingosine kinase
MGDTRSVVGLMQEIFSRHTYGVKAAIQVVESDKAKIQSNYRAHYSSAIPSPSIDENSQDAVMDTIPDLDKPVPNDWMLIEGDMTVFLASKVPLLSRGMLSHPCALPNDGTIDLLLMRGKQSIAKQLDMFTKVEKGQHMESDIVSLFLELLSSFIYFFLFKVEYYKVKAFRLEPVLKPGQKAYVAIDGEHAPCKPFQVEVHPSLATVLSINSSFVDTKI